MSRNKKIFIALLVVGTVIAIVTAVIIKAENDSGPSVKPGDYTRSDVDITLNLVLSSDVTLRDSSFTSTNNDVVIIDPSIVVAKDITVVQTVMTSAENHFTFVETHVTYIYDFWCLTNGQVWVIVNSDVKVYKNNVLQATLTNLVISEALALDDTRVVVVSNGVISMYVNYVKKLDVFFRGNRNLVKSHGYLYIGGPEISPETKNGVLYVYNVVTLKLHRVLVDEKLVALMVVGYLYEREGRNFASSIDVSPDGRLLAVGSPDGDYKSNDITFPGGQLRMPNGFFMLFEKFALTTDPLDDYNYPTRVSNEVSGCGAMVRFMTDNYLLVTNTTNNIVHVYYVSGSAIPKIMTMLQFASRVTNVIRSTTYGYTLVQTTTHLYYVSWQKPVIDTQQVGGNLFGTLVIRSSFEGGLWRVNGNVLLSQGMKYTIN